MGDDHASCTERHVRTNGLLRDDFAANAKEATFPHRDVARQPTLRSYMNSPTDAAIMIHGRPRIDDRQIGNR